ncbi:Hypothetical protein CINCED_3A010598 [Cinara cedri]|uniref:Uncharacterized protein n=1 Tax=Cinara cedri TaxID=506608 RepID=A0A5E4NLF3_9HEMI|nr:Hypothetical protein CINCED_3A010598 [Cinara cedri]
MSYIKPAKHDKIKVNNNTHNNIRMSKKQYSMTIDKSEIMQDFNVTHTEAALRLLKNNTAAGTDSVLPEFVTHLGPKSKWFMGSFGEDQYANRGGSTRYINCCEQSKYFHY